MRMGLCQHIQRQVCTAMMPTSQRKLVLHFDINKTIVAVDSATGETVQDALNVYLSGMAWGRDMEGTWQCSKGELSSTPCENGDVSFYKFEEKRLVRKLSHDRSTFRFHLSSFTDKPQGSNFKPYLNMLLQRLMWTLPYDEAVHECMTVPGSKNCRFHFILPSFFNLLNYLEEEKRDYTVIFRTFGNDATNVLRCIKAAVANAMPFCRKLESLVQGMSEEVLILNRHDDGLFSLSPLNSTEPVKPENLKTDKEMYETLTKSSGIVAIQDNVGLWYEHNFHPSKGKPLWLDHTDTEVQHIFFDDNIRPGMADSILNLRVKKSEEVQYSDVDIGEDDSFVDVNMVPVSFAEAILNENYFVDKVTNCEEKFSKRLAGID